MRVLVDTNVLISAVLKDRDPETILLYVVSNPDVEWIVSHGIISEYKDVLRRKKFGLPENIVLSWCELIDSFAAVVNPDIPVDFPRDQKDAKFLACALASDADYFVTGDRDFKQPLKLGNTIILSVKQFKKFMIDDVARP